MHRSSGKGDDIMELGNQIRQLRMQRGITQEAMAMHLGITSQAISKWERGITMPDIGLLPDISAKAHVLYL